MNAVIMNTAGQVEVKREPFTGVTTELIRCDCEHSYQDQKYGYKLRVHNRGPVGAKGGSPKKRCTVCGKER